MPCKQRGLSPYRGQIATNKRQVARTRFRSTPEARSRRNSRIWPLRGQIFGRIDGGIQQGQGPQQNASARPGRAPAACRLRPGCVPAVSRLRPGCVPSASPHSLKTCPPRYDCHRNPNEPPPKTVLGIELNPSRSKTTKTALVRPEPPLTVTRRILNSLDEGPQVMAPCHNLQPNVVDGNPKTREAWQCNKPVPHPRIRGAPRQDNARANEGSTEVPPGTSEEGTAPRSVHRRGPWAPRPPRRHEKRPATHAAGTRCSDERKTRTNGWGPGALSHAPRPPVLGFPEPGR